VGRKIHPKVRKSSQSALSFSKTIYKNMIPIHYQAVERQRPQTQRMQGARPTNLKTAVKTWP
jgi:hypothetical protein